MASFADINRRRNGEVADGWERFGPHREKVTQLLLAAAAERKEATLCVLGAGNCNDLELNLLIDAFVQVMLVDLDQEALKAGLERQTVVRASQISLRGNIDLCGLAEQDLKDAAGCLAVLRSHAPALGGPYDVVASTCLLSQLISAVAQNFSSHPQFLELVAAVRLRHLQLLLSSTRPGGTAVLITDFVSSETCPELQTSSVEQLPAIVSRALAARNFLTGLHPGVLHELILNDPSLRSFIAGVSVSTPWLWDLGPRIYAVCAFTLRRNNS